MKKIAFMLIAMIVTNLYAKDDNICKVFAPKLEVDKKVETDVSGSLSTLFKLGRGTAEIKHEVEKNIKNFSEKYPNVNSAIIESSYLYLTCIYLEKSDLSDKEKLDYINTIRPESINKKTSLEKETSSSNDKIIVSIDTVVEDEIEYKITSCFQKSQSISCNFIVTNKDIDRELEIFNESFLVDVDGEKYKASKLNFGKKTSFNRRKLLVKDISVKSKIVFSKVDSLGDLIPRLTLSTRISNYQKITFRNIPLKH